MDHHLLCGDFFSGCPDCLLPYAGSPPQCKTGKNIPYNVHRQHVHGDRHRNSFNVKQTASIRKKTTQLLLGFCFLVTTVTVVMNQSRGALIGLGIALLVMCLNQKRTIVFFCSPWS